MRITDEGSGTSERGRINVEGSPLSFIVSYNCTFLLTALGCGVNFLFLVMI